MEIDALVSVAAADFRRRPMPRARVNATQWQQAIEELAAGKLTLMGLWAHRSTVFMALLAPQTHRLGVIGVRCRDNAFASVGRAHAPAQRLERTIRDLNGLEPEGAPDSRPWLDHGRWGVAQPLGRGTAVKAEPVAYSFLPVEGESLHQVPVGPVHAGIIEPGHFRFTAQGETIVRLEERLGYVHKGVETLMRGATLARGAEIAARTSGDSTVAYGWAFAQAAEAALGITVPTRALYLRAIMAEMERLANHLGDIGAICNDASFAIMLAHMAVLREKVLRTADSCFGHRLMRDRIVPGGVSHDPGDAGLAAIGTLIAEIGERFEPLVELYDNTASLLDRTVSTGHLKAELAARFGAGGFIGRASGRDFDARRDLPYAPYDRFDFAVPVRRDGDVNARVWIRIEEVRQSLAIVKQCLAGLPGGAFLAELPAMKKPCEGLGLVEGFRGDILVWLALDARGRIERCHLRDPSWFQWPLLEAVVEGNIVADFPLCNKSFNCSYSGHDL